MTQFMDLTRWPYEWGMWDEPNDLPWADPQSNPLKDIQNFVKNMRDKPYQWGNVGPVGYDVGPIAKDFGKIMGVL